MTQRLFEMPLRTELVSEKKVSRPEYGMADGRMIRISGFPCDDLSSMREIEHAHPVNGLLEVHRETAQQTHLLTGIVEPLRETKGDIERGADLFAVSFGKHERKRERRAHFQLMRAVILRRHPVKRLLHPAPTLGQKGHGQEQRTGSGRQPDGQFIAPAGTESPIEGSADVSEAILREPRMLGDAQFEEFDAVGFQ